MLRDGERPILFFDGVCGLCNAAVDAILAADRRGEIRFAPIQGETAKRLLPPLPEDPLEWTLLYLDERGLHRYSDAAIEVSRRIGGFYAIAGLLRIVPRPLRDPVYRWIARNRYGWFGKRDSCRVPGPAERARFLP
jgi:predicted DCC family thiol-disulfide oxidoreductase YuxK